MDALSLAETTRRICALIASGEGGYVVTLNPEIVMRARRDSGLAEVIRAAWLVSADGMGVLWALRLAGHTIPERVTGVDLVESLAAQAAARDIPVFLLGAGDGVAQAVARRLTERLPGLRIVGVWGGSPRPEDDAQTVAQIRLSGARLLLVAYGAPAQELWIARNLASLPGVVALGVGGAFDMLAERIPRAPRLLRDIGLEWLYRLLREPWRLRRMLALPQFAALCITAAAHRWLTRAPDTGILALRDSSEATRAPDERRSSQEH